MKYSPMQRILAYGSPVNLRKTAQSCLLEYVFSSNHDVCFVMLCHAMLYLKNDSCRQLCHTSRYSRGEDEWRV